jgi:hypothetical protein
MNRRPNYFANYLAEHAIEIMVAFKNKEPGIK